MNMTHHKTAEASPLGKKVFYDQAYHPEHLYPISRGLKREEIGIVDTLPFFGFDIWNHYEVSWLNEKGKPVVALAEIIYSCDSKNIIESKSMKLYFNSLNATRFSSCQAVETLITHDLKARLNTSFLKVKITPLSLFKEELLCKRLPGLSLDELDIECIDYHNNTSYLMTTNIFVEETLCSDLLKSNCLITNQPDWCSIQIHYAGNKINHEGLLKYLISFRNDNEFHEQCIEKIFMHLMRYCEPTKLTIIGRSTRRGGVDINSSRSTLPIDINNLINLRLCRQ